MTLPTLALLVSLAASTRGAPTAEEQRLYAEGLEAWKAGDARGAERAWSEGYGVAHDPAFLVHIGEAQEKAGLPAEAVDSYRRYVREAPDASDRADIEGRIARLAPAPAPAAAEPSEPAGEFGATPAGAPPAPAPAAATPEPVGDPETARRPKDDPDSGWTRYNVTAMSAAGVSVLLLGTAAFFGAEASSKEGDANRLQTFRNERTGAPIAYSSVATQYEGTLADGRRGAHDARLALLGAAGAAAVSVVFFVLDAHFGGEGPVAFAVAPGSGARLAASATATWRF